MFAIIKNFNATANFVPVTEECELKSINMHSLFHMQIKKNVFPSHISDVYQFVCCFKIACYGII